MGFDPYQFLNNRPNGAKNGPLLVYRADAMHSPLLTCPGNHITILIIKKVTWRLVSFSNPLPNEQVFTILHRLIVEDPTVTVKCRTAQ